MKKICENAIKYCGLACLVVVLIPCVRMFGAAGRDMTTNIKGVEAGGDVTVITHANSNVFSCAGTGTPCNYAANAVGDLKEIEITAPRRATHNLRAIAARRTISLTLPLIGNQELFTCVLTKPFSSDPLDMAMVGVPMQILLVGSVSDAEALKLKADTQSMVKIYRRMRGKGDLSETLWTEAATLVSNATDTDELLPATLILNADGTAEFVTNEGEPAALFLGKAILG
jgi:hypothetical protein